MTFAWRNGLTTSALSKRLLNHTQDCRAPMTQAARTRPSLRVKLAASVDLATRGSVRSWWARAGQHGLNASAQLDPKPGLTPTRRQRFGRSTPQPHPTLRTGDFCGLFRFRVDPSNVGANGFNERGATPCREPRAPGILGKMSRCALVSKRYGSRLRWHIRSRATLWPLLRSEHERHDRATTV